MCMKKGLEVPVTCADVSRKTHRGWCLTKDLVALSCTGALALDQRRDGIYPWLTSRIFLGKHFSSMSLVSVELLGQIASNGPVPWVSTFWFTWHHHMWWEISLALSLHICITDQTLEVVKSWNKATYSPHDCSHNLNSKWNSCHESQ